LIWFRNSVIPLHSQRLFLAEIQKMKQVTNGTRNSEVV
jgi:hypothetical protein